MPGLKPTTREMSDTRDRLIVALDVGTPDEALALVERIGNAASFYKIGYRLAYAGGLSLVPRLASAGLKVFVDLKLHDIGNTVEDGVRALSDLGAAFLTVHAYPQTMRAAVRGRGSSGSRLLAVTVLTSYDKSDLAEAGYALDVPDLVALRARQAAETGIDGIVCAAFEAEAVRREIGTGRAIVTPGIRPSGSAAGDQKRVMTPAQAKAAGIDHIVVGRPITGAEDPRAVVQAILADLV
ncbi:MAG: orotidine-5'-phosphate decarboxylase [Methylobacterium sp.]|uniref:orotidine-5'-phosphate decarboxylase n=1 Tax=Methylobacterium sp. TaxID=409 RepID=UPI0025F748F0|nr:orotidine-5'-phosphate decarboxylase [Methylobacterium sp.]MBX9930518.1 orotidine-5'-phosphate decarboxylase [Methylobacterium sp.]